MFPKVDKEGGITTLRGTPGLAEFTWIGPSVNDDWSVLLGSVVPGGVESVANQIILTASGTWASGYRPTNAYTFFTGGSGGVRITMRDVGNNIIADSLPSLLDSGDALAFSFNGYGDIFSFGAAGTSLFTISTIRFD